MAACLRERDARHHDLHLGRVGDVVVLGVANDENRARTVGALRRNCTEAPDRTAVLALEHRSRVRVGKLAAAFLHRARDLRPAVDKLGPGVERIVSLHWLIGRL